MNSFQPEASVHILIQQLIEAKSGLLGKAECAALSCLSEMALINMPHSFLCLRENKIATHERISQSLPATQPSRRKKKIQMASGTRTGHIFHIKMGLITINLHMFEI